MSHPVTDPDAPLPFGHLVPKSELDGIAWPAFPPLRGLVLLGLLYQFERSQWWSPDQLRVQQFRQLGHLFRHAHTTTRHYRRLFNRIGLDPTKPLDEDTWRSIPLLQRDTLQRHELRLRSTHIPQPHGPTHELISSGSTGRRVAIQRTDLGHQIWCAVTLREHAWHGRDLGAKLAIIRHPANANIGNPPDGTPSRGWGPATHNVFPTGPSTLLSIHTDIATQAAWLLREDPDYLLTHPSVLSAIAKHFRDHGERPRKLRGLRTISETLPNETRALCQEVFGLPIVDAYSSMEAGYIALQCPENPGYHLQSDTVLTEVLRDDGTPCAPGEVGRVVVTPLHNFATILIRYQLGDYAEVGEPCPCGRGLPVIRRIAGRVRNLLTLPDGRKVWPRLKTTAYGQVAPVHQLQLVQTSLTHIEARFAVDRPVTADEQGRLREAIHNALGHPFEVSFVWFEDEIPRSPGGKYEDFRSDIAS